MSFLPRDLLLIILVGLEKTRDILTCMAVCKRWRDILQTEFFWKKRLAGRPWLTIILGTRAGRDIPFIALPNRSDSINLRSSNRIGLNFLLTALCPFLHVVLLEADPCNHRDPAERDFLKCAPHLTLLAHVLQTRDFSSVTNLTLVGHKYRFLLATQLPCLKEVVLYVAETPIVPEWILNLVVTVHFSRHYVYGTSYNTLFLDDLPVVKHVTFAYRCQIGWSVLSWETQFVSRASQICEIHNVWLDVYEEFSRDLNEQMTWLTSTFFNLLSLTVVLDCEPANDSDLKDISLFDMPHSKNKLKSLTFVFAIETTVGFEGCVKMIGSCWADNVKTIKF